MKPVLAVFSRLVLILCLSLYGPSAMALTGGDGSGLFMEICADGVVKTVQVDANGAPVDTESGTECNDCLTCWQSPAMDGPTAPAVSQPMTVWTVSDCPTSGFGCVLQTSNTRPLPRGPPALIESHSIMPDAIATDRPEGPSGMCRTGRPYFKDAVA